MRRRMPIEDEQRIAELYRDGYSISQVAREVHWSDMAVLRALDRAGVKRRPEGGTGAFAGYPREQVELVVLLYRFYGVKDVARLTGMSVSAVRNRLLAAGAPLRPRGAAGRGMVRRRLPRVRVAGSASTEAA